jgi:hypothetical protein
MKKILVVGLAALFLAVAFSPAVRPASAQTVVVVGAPWLGPGSPWFWYNNAWYYNGILYGYYGGMYGWRPFGSITNAVVEYPTYYYSNPKWGAWVHRNPQHLHNWQHQYHGGMRNPHYVPPAHHGPGPQGPQAHGPQYHQGPQGGQAKPVAGPAHLNATPVAGPARVQGQPLAGPARTAAFQPQNQFQSHPGQVQNVQHQGHGSQQIHQQPHAQPRTQSKSAPARSSGSSSKKK